MRLLNWERFMIVSDVHGDMQDEGAVNAVRLFLDNWKPTIRIHLGDNFDFRPLRKKADEDERRERMRKDFDAGIEFIRMYRPTHFCRGNHDERLYDLAEANKGPLSEYAESLIKEFEKSLGRVEALPYDSHDGVLRVGSVTAVHGFFAGVMAARMSAQVYGSVYVGHGHGIQCASVAHINNSVGRMIGCLCKLYMKYSRATTAQLVHAHGFVYGVINRKTGEHLSWQAESCRGIWILPSDFQALAV